MVTRLEIALRPGLPDPRGEHAARKVRDFLGLGVERIRTRDVYKIEGDVSQEEAERILHEFCDPVQHAGALGRIDDGSYDFAEVTRRYQL